MELRGSALPFWCGWGEARRLGVAPRRGSRGVTILRPLPLGGIQGRGADAADRALAAAADRQPGVLGESDGEHRPGDISGARASRGGGVRWRPLVVFNAADLVGDGEAARALSERIQRCLAAARSGTPPAGERLARAEATLAAWPVAVLEGGSNACYVPASDRIHLPAAAAFTGPAARLATWAHEAIHSTGHPSRLGRDLQAPFGSAAYAREELVAELGAVLLGERLAIGSDTANHAAYLEHWCALLRESPRLLLRVLAEARRAADLIAPESTPDSAPGTPHDGAGSANGDAP
ncbi:MAG: zincin-like metallopeptidase domain-containing protein, partial [Cyanobium sp.]